MTFWWPKAAEGLFDCRKQGTAIAIKLGGEMLGFFESAGLL
jgi:hypothetical protein